MTSAYKILVRLLGLKLTADLKKKMQETNEKQVTNLSIWFNSYNKVSKLLLAVNTRGNQV